MLKKKTNSSESETDWKRIPKRLKKQFSPLLKKMILKLRKISFRRVLGRSCPLPATFRVAVEKWNKSGSASLCVEELINMNVMGEKVAQFVLRCIHNIFPRTIFGSDLNWKIFRQAVHTLIERQLKEQFDVIRYFSQHAFKITDVPWLHTTQKEGVSNSCQGDHGRKIRNPTDLKFRQTCMNDFLIWLFRGIIIPLLQHNFCMTEGNLDKNRVFFFHREVWTHMLNVTNKKVLRTNGQFRILSSSQLSESVASRAIMNSKLGDIGSPCSSILYYHRMRFIPKRKSLRWIQLPRYELVSGFNLPGSNNTLPITKLKNQRRVNEQFSLRCIRLLMNQIVRILIAESRVSSSKQVPSNLGASVFSLDDIYSKWVSLKDKWVRRDRPKMYVCCVDITQSFDTIPLTELLDNVVPNILSKARYPVVRMRVCKKNPGSRQFIYQTINHVCTKSGDETSLSRLLTKHLLPRHAGSIISDCANVTSLNRDDILAILKEFIAKNLVAVPRRVRSKKESGFALQIQGVPQGHPLSPILTTLFYGHVERQDLVEFFEGDTSQNCTAKNTTKVPNLEKDCPPNSLTVNDNPESNEKEEPDCSLKMHNLVSLFMRQMDDTIFICNDISHSTKFLKRMISGWEFSHGFSVNPEKTKSSFKASVGGLENLKVLPWCGLLINVDTLEIRSDYSRYSCLRDHVTIEHEWESGRVWMQRSLAGFNPKVHPIFFDHRINSSFTICINVYQAAVLCGLKVSSSLLALRHVQNPQFVASVFSAASDNFSKIISQAMVRKVASVETQCPFILSNIDIKFLTVCAFKQCVHHAFLSDKRHRRVIGNAITCKLTECFDVLRAKVCKRQGGSKLVETAQKIAAEECSFFWSIEL